MQLLNLRPLSDGAVCRKPYPFVPNYFAKTGCDNEKFDYMIAYFFTYISSQITANHHFFSVRNMEGILVNQSNTG